MQNLNNSFIPVIQEQNQNTDKEFHKSTDQSKNTQNHLIDQANHRLKFYSHHFFEILISIILTTQGIKGIYQSIKFVLFDYPLLEKQLVLHRVSQDQINHFIVYAVVTLFSTMISFFFALKISVLKSKTFHLLNKFIGLVLIIFNASLAQYVEKIISLELVQNIIDSIFLK